MTMSSFAAALAVAALLIPGQARAQEALDLDKFAYGEHVASRCAVCHGQPGSSAGATISGIPDIWRIERSAFRERMLAAKNGSSNPTVRLVTSAMTEEEIDALVYYFEKR